METRWHFPKTVNLYLLPSYLWRELMHKVKIVLSTVGITFVSILCLFLNAYANNSGKLYVVGMGPAGPDLTAPRALSIVQKADVILCSPGMPKKFKMFGTYIDSGKVAFNPWEGIMGEKVSRLKKTDYDAWAAGAEKQRKKVQEFVRSKIEKGKTVVMMDGGDPCVYGPSLHYLLKGFDESLFEVVAGMGAFNAAGAALKRSFTSNDVRFVLLTSPQSMFGKNGEKGDDILKDLSKYETTMIWYMSLRSIAKVVAQLQKYYPPDLPIAIVYYAGYPDKEKVLKSRLASIVNDVKKLDEQWLGLFVAGKCAE
jgi:precorrin-4 methylase